LKPQERINRPRFYYDSGWVHRGAEQLCATHGCCDVTAYSVCSVHLSLYTSLTEHINKKTKIYKIIYIQAIKLGSVRTTFSNSHD